MPILLIHQPAQFAHNEYTSDHGTSHCVCACNFAAHPTSILDIDALSDTQITASANYERLVDLEDFHFDRPGRLYVTNPICIDGKNTH